jgi:hypothetical protein
MQSAIDQSEKVYRRCLELQNDPIIKAYGNMIVELKQMCTKIVVRINAITEQPLVEYVYSDEINTQISKLEKLQKEYAHCRYPDLFEQTRTDNEL